MANDISINTHLNNMPLVGLGTFRSDDKALLKQAVKHAIKVGYRHIDCAWVYGNEDAIGQAIKESIAESNGTLKREDLYIVSKLWNTFHSKHLVKGIFSETLSKLDLQYIDLYLMHWPMGYAENLGESIPKDKDGNRLYSDVHYLETYKAMEELIKEGKVKNLGVSNFNISQIQDILSNCEIKPINNQVEVNPYIQNDKLIDFCQKNSIIVSAYGPIGAGQKSTNRPDLPILLENETLKRIGNKYGKTPAQVCLRWLLQRNLVVLPKSVTPSRIEENIQLFDFSLSVEDMSEIKGLNQNLRNYGVEMTKNHKFYPFHHD